MKTNHQNLQLPSNKILKNLSKIVEMALIEDNVFNDITSDLTINDGVRADFQINARQDLVFCGKFVVEEVFCQLKNSKKFQNSKIDFNCIFDDGALVKKSQNIVLGNGDTKIILAGERIILNLVQHLSAIATNTRDFVARLNNPKIKILDTRKTLPNLRELQKYAVLCGGGHNHRFNLADLILIKDNHISACGGVSQALLRSKNFCGDNKIEIECDNFAQVSEALEHNPDIIMLDNMALDEAQKSIALIRKNNPQILIEISGGINIENIGQYSLFDVDFISVGSLTNSFRSVDIGLDFL